MMDSESITMVTFNTWSFNRIYHWAVLCLFSGLVNSLLTTHGKIDLFRSTIKLRHTPVLVLPVRVMFVRMTHMEWWQKVKGVLSVVPTNLSALMPKFHEAFPTQRSQNFTHFPFVCQIILQVIHRHSCYANTQRLLQRYQATSFT